MESNLDISKLSTKELRDLKKKIQKELSERHRAEIIAKKRFCESCEHYIFSANPKEELGYCNRNDYYKQYCFHPDHPRGKYIERGSLVPSWCPLNKEENDGK